MHAINNAREPKEICKYLLHVGSVLDNTKKTVWTSRQAFQTGHDNLSLIWRLNQNTYPGYTPTRFGLASHTCDAKPEVEKALQREREIMTKCTDRERLQQ